MFRDRMEKEGIHHESENILSRVRWRSTMHLVLMNLAYTQDLETPDELLDRFRMLPGWCEAVVAAVREGGGEEARVTVIQRFHHDGLVKRNGVVYRFVSDGLGADFPWWRSAGRVVEHAVAECRATARGRCQGVVHLNCLGYAAVVPTLRRALPRSIPIVVQHHAERPRTGLSGLHQEWALARADGFLFAARGLAEDWRERRVIRGDAPIFEVVEGSTTFTVSDRTAARRRTGMDGSPVFLWVGRLDANKDPLSILTGLAPVFRELPEARLFMAHGPDSPLLETVRATIAESKVLRRAVRLLGTVPHTEIEAVFNSADYFVLGSRYESSGFALAEALACGVVPIVTDIPSFRRMTDGGAVGALWRPGRPEAMTAAVQEVVRAPPEESSAAARALFDARSSFAAIGRDALSAYRKTHQTVVSGPGGGRVG